MRQDEHTLLRLLIYPLRFGNLLIIIIFSGIFTFLFATFKAGFIQFHPGFELMFTMGIIAFFPFINGLFEHGLNIIESTAAGEQEPPVLQAKALFGGRFLKQLLMLALFLFASFLLTRAGHHGSAIIIFIFVVWVLPASLAIHSLYDSFTNMINPFILIPLIFTLGFPYLISILLLLPIAMIAIALPDENLSRMLFQVPMAMYFFLLFLRYLGLCMYRRRDLLNKEIEFDSTRREVFQKEESVHKLNEGLLRANDFIRAGDIEKANKLILPLTKVNSWARFDHVFNIVSNWKNSLPALALTKQYIPYLIEKQHFMQAFKLFQWSLKNDHSFFLNQDFNPGSMLDHAVTPEQFHTVAQLMSNYVQACPSVDNAVPLLSTAVGIYQEKLKEIAIPEKLIQQLKERDPDLFSKISGAQ